MAQSTPKKKINSQQKEFLVDYVEKNKNVLFGKFSNANVRAV